MFGRPVKDRYWFLQACCDFYNSRGFLAAAANVREICAARHCTPQSLYDSLVRNSQKKAA